MSKIRSLIAFALVLVLCLSMVGCHPKDEIALTIGGVEISSAMYGCALIQADLDARAMIDKQNGAIGVVDYLSQSIDGMKYTEWVEDRALQLCKLYAAYTLKLKELNLTVSEETKNNVYQECYMDWVLGSTIFSSSSYTAYASIMEPNGVSFNTFYNFNMSGGYDETIFTYYYGDKGVNKLSDEEIDKFYTENFGLIYDINISYGDKATDAEKKEVDDLIADFKARLEKGEDFATIKADWDKFEEKRKKDTTTSSGTTSSNTSSDATSSGTASDTTSSDATSSGNTSSKEEEKPKAKDENATLVWGSAAGSNSDSNFQNIKNMAIGDVKQLEVSGGWRLIKKLDLMSDSYYRDINYLAIANVLKGEDFSKDIQAFADSLEIVKNSFAMSQYTVKKLNYTNA